eukprot:6391105-Prymnesium_polylepis.2
MGVRDDVCLVLHTSGTTAKPKIVPLHHENLACGALCIAQTPPRLGQPQCHAALSHSRHLNQRASETARVGMGRRNVSCAPACVSQETRPRVRAPRPLSSSSSSDSPPVALPYNCSPHSSLERLVSLALRSTLPFSSPSGLLPSHDRHGTRLCQPSTNSVSAPHTLAAQTPNGGSLESSLTIRRQWLSAEVQTVACSGPAVGAGRAVRGDRTLLHYSEAAAAAVAAAVAVAVAVAVLH